MSRPPREFPAFQPQGHCLLPRVFPLLVFSSIILTALLLFVAIATGDDAGVVQSLGAQLLLCFRDFSASRLWRMRPFTGLRCAFFHRPPLALDDFGFVVEAVTGGYDDSLLSFARIRFVCLDSTVSSSLHP